jgi:hypothetical protein
MAQQKKKKISILRRFLSKFKPKETSHTKQTQEQLQQAGVTEKEMPSDVAAMKEKTQPKTVERKPATAPRIPVSEAVSIAEKIVEMEKEKKKKKPTALTGSRKGK